MALLLALRGLHVFSSSSVALTGILMLAAAWWTCPKPDREPKPPPAVGDTISAVLVLVLAIIYLSSPGDYLAGNWDPGVYLAQGAAATRNPGWTIEDSASGIIAGEMVPSLYATQNQQPVKYPGFYSPGPPFGQLVPQFAPLYATLLAVAYWAGGMALALRMDGLFILLAIVLMANLARLITGKSAASIGCILLFGFHPVTVWFARFHTTESLTLFLFCVLTGSACHLSRSPKWTPVMLVSASSLLLSWSTVAAIPAAVSALVFVFKRECSIRQRLTLFLSTTVGVLSAGLFFLLEQQPYARHLHYLLPHWKSLLPPLSPRYLIAGAAGLATAGFLLLFMAKRVPNRLPPRGTLLLSLALLFTALATALSHAAIPRLSPYLNGIVSLVPLSWWPWILGGFISTLVRFPGLRLWACWAFAITLIMTIYFWHWPAIPLLYPWTWKRWIWILLPIAALFGSIGITQWHAADGRTTAIARWATLLMLISLPALHHAQLLRGGEWRHLRQWLQTISRGLPPDAVVIAPREIATPLEFIFGHTVIPLYHGNENDREDTYLKIWRDPPARRPVVVIASEPPPWLPDAGHSAVSLPPYVGDWIQPSRYPANFRRQPRGFSLLLWTSHPDHPDDGGPPTKAPP